ncbi:MAG TPA: S-layer homology domain-containing protein [Chthonomonadaceae bacterium]|nr:S-layer homology domain-containing protein [Chthonomonadaceae bacterium]
MNLEHANFRDVAGSEWAFGAVLVAAGSGVMQGYPDRAFRRNQSVTRREFAVTLARLLEGTR